MASHRSRPFRSLFLGSVALGAATYAGIAAYARKNTMLPPWFLAKYALTPNSEVGQLFPSRVIERSATPIETPHDLVPVDQVIPWKGEYRGLTRVLRETKTNAFLVAKNGTVVHSWVRDRFSTTTPHSSWSVAKSVVSLLIGQLIDEGKLGERDRLTEILPEFATGTAFDSVTVQHLLDMQSGILMPEDYTMLKPYTGVAGMLSTLDLPGYLFDRRALYTEPGTVTEYRSVDTQYLSMIVSRVENAPLAEIVQRKLWDPMGALDTAYWNTDVVDGIEKGFAMLNASARDFLKIGQLMLNRGRVGAKQVVPEAWIERIRAVASHPVHEARTWGYSAQWWHPHGHETDGDFTALGVNGQFIYVNPKHQTVIVKLSDHGTEEDEDELIEMFRAMARTA